MISTGIVQITSKVYVYIFILFMYPNLIIGKKNLCFCENGECILSLKLKHPSQDSELM